MPKKVSFKNYYWNTAWLRWRHGQKRPYYFSLQSCRLRNVIWLGFVKLKSHLSHTLSERIKNCHKNRTLIYFQLNKAQFMKISSIHENQHFFENETFLCQWFFSCLLITKIGRKINLRIKAKNNRADLEIGLLKKSISKPYGRATAMTPAWELNWDLLEHLAQCLKASPVEVVEVVKLLNLNRVFWLLIQSGLSWFPNLNTRS